MKRAWMSLLSVVACLILSGCSSVPRSAVMVVEADQYAPAFDAAKDVLRSYGFELERVDARTGVVTSRPRRSSGFATPWVPHPSDLGDAWRGLLHGESRTVTIDFRPQAGSGPLQLRRDPRYDLRVHPGPVRISVEVLVERESRPGLRADPTSVRLLSSATSSPTDNKGAIFVPVGRDAALAGRIANAISQRLTPRQAAPGESSELLPPQAKMLSRITPQPIDS